jgi:hypothetical protein
MVDYLGVIPASADEKDRLRLGTAKERIMLNVYRNTESETTLKSW